MLYPATCVGLGYGPPRWLFLGVAIARSLRPGTRLGGLFRQPPRVLAPRHLFAGGRRNLDLLSIGVAFRLALRARLTLIRRTLIRNPWPCGVGDFRPHCRYLCLHLLFRPLHRGSRLRLRRGRNAPLPTAPCGAAPRLRRRAYARSLSTPARSTSELLRTL